MSNGGGGEIVSKNFPKDALKAINKKGGKNISENAVKKLAGTVKPDTLQNETQLRQLIKQVSAMANIPVSEDTVRDIVGAVKKSGMNPSNMEALMKMMMKK
nr:stage VI sporulation protein F [Paenibacillus sp. AK121]